jgi:hypothetical protein
MREAAMTARRGKRGCSRRAVHHQRRTGGIMRQEGESKSEGPDDSAKAAKATVPQKARKA